VNTFAWTGAGFLRFWCGEEDATLGTRCSYPNPREGNEKP